METQPSSKQGTTFLRTCFNGLNALSGIGVLSIPYALSHGGWFSLALFILFATICCYTGLLLKRCMDASTLVKTYPDIGKFAFGQKGRITVAAVMYLELYLVAIGFLILEGDNLEKLFPVTRFSIGGMHIGGKHGFVVLAALVVLPTTWLRSLGMLAYVSFGGVIASVILVACVLWTGAAEGEGFHERGSLFKWSGLPTSVSLYIFCYSGHAVFPTLYTSMRNKVLFFRVMLISFLLCTLCYGSMAVLGYLMYGADVKSQVTLNLPNGKLSTKIAIYTTLINPLTKYALLITPIAEATEDYFHVSKQRATCLLIRTVLVVGTMIAALVLPFFGYLTAFTGSFLSTTASIILPCICYLKIINRSRRWGVEQVFVVVIAVVGILVGIVGTYYSTMHIVRNV